MKRMHPARLARGLTLIELLLFIAVVGIALAAMLRVFATATAASAATSSRSCSAANMAVPSAFRLPGSASVISNRRSMHVLRASMGGAEGSRGFPGKSTGIPNPCAREPYHDGRSVSPHALRQSP